MKPSFITLSLIMTVILGFVFLSIIVVVAFFVPVKKEQSSVPIPTAIVEDTPIAFQPDAEFSLKTIAGDGKLLYIGVGGDIDGIINPDLVVQPGAVVRIVLINGDGMVHDLFLSDFNAKTEYVKKISDQAEIVFEVGDRQPGSYVYYCTLPGHRKAGQEGKLIVTKP
jgi:nitrite reductase (NO-forming)